MTLADYIAAGGSEKAFKRDVASGSIVVDVQEGLNPLERPARRIPPGPLAEKPKANCAPTLWIFRPMSMV
jgi:hypothetical protein